MIIIFKVTIKIIPYGSLLKWVMSRETLTWKLKLANLLSSCLRWDSWYQRQVSRWSEAMHQMNLTHSLPSSPICLNPDLSIVPDLLHFSAPLAGSPSCRCSLLILILLYSMNTPSKVRLIPELHTLYNHLHVYLLL